jgi:hypothetical protein
MKNILKIIFPILSCISMANGQDVVSELKNNAFPIEELQNLDSTIYQQIKNYDLIMVGEMHGTNEPALFVYGLLKLLSEMGNAVILAIEIPKSSIGDVRPFNKKNLLLTDFFSMENTDGRNGKAWFELILKSSALNNVTVEFFDNEHVSPRDSSMYLDILKLKRNNKGSKIVTLSGNIHNWLKPFRDSPTMGTYIINDSTSFSASKIMSINHIYNEGTMMNNIGKGLELRIVEGKNNFYNQTIASKMYLCKTLFKSQNQYTHFLYTEKVTHSEKVK